MGLISSLKYLRKALISGLFFCLLFPAKAQFAVDTVYVEYQGPKLESVFYSTIELLNSADTNFTIEWELVKQDIPSAWSSTYTVGFDWYEDTVLTGSYSLPPSDSIRSFAVVQFYPNNTADTGDYEIKFRVSTDTSMQFTLRFRGIAYSTSSKALSIQKSLEMFPNPLGSGQTLNGLSGTCVVYSLSGKLIWKGDAKEIDHAVFPEAGTYLIQNQASSKSLNILRLVVLP